MSLASPRLACRSLAARPTLTLAALLTIALAVAATTAIYSAVQAVLLTPLPFDSPERLVSMFGTDLRKAAALV